MWIKVNTLTSKQALNGSWMKLSLKERFEDGNVHFDSLGMKLRVKVELQRLKQPFW
jgi:hypothetical protein